MAYLEESQIKSALLIGLSIACLIFISKYVRENFEPIGSSPGQNLGKWDSEGESKPRIVTKHTNVTNKTDTDSNTATIVGDITKTYDITTGGIVYQFNFNLADPTGGPYNAIETAYYLVSGGLDFNALVPIGKLSKTSDGWYRFTYKEGNPITKCRIDYINGDAKIKVLEQIICG